MKLKIKIEIKSKEGFTEMNYDNFDGAILGLINEREIYNYEKSNKLKTKIIKRMK